MWLDPASGHEAQADGSRAASLRPCQRCEAAQRNSLAPHALGPSARCHHQENWVHGQRGLQLELSSLGDPSCPVRLTGMVRGSIMLNIMLEAYGNHQVVLYVLIDMQGQMLVDTQGQILIAALCQ